MTDYGDIFGGSTAEADQADETVGRPRGLYYGVPDTWLQTLGQQYAETVPLPSTVAQADYYAERGAPKLYATSEDVDRKVLLSLPPEALAQLQDAMAGVGLYGATARYVNGFPDDTTRKAFVKLLGYANQRGTTWSTALTEMQRSGGALGLTGVGDTDRRQGAVQAVSAPVSLEQQMQQSAQQRIGRKLKKTEVDRFVSVYQGMERSLAAQERQASDQAALGADTMLTQIPASGAAAEQFLEANYATEEAALQSVDYLDTLRGMLGG